MTSSMHQNATSLTFVLTLALSGTGRDDNDLERADLMFKSFCRFFDKRCLEEFIIVTPDEQTEAVQSVLQPGLDRKKLRVIAESTVCPEFLENPDTSNLWPNPNKGWFRQQLIKLAIHEQVKTPFYMTVDADVVFTRPFSSSLLITDGRAILNTQNVEDFRQLYQENIAEREVRIRRHRYKRVEQILKCSRPEQFLDHWYGETPVLLNREIVQKLALHIEQAWNQPWRQTLLDQLPWTEYALYFEFAEYSRLLEKYYCSGHMDTLLNLSNSLWRRPDEYRERRSLANWDVDKAFGQQGDSVAVVVQSYLEYPVAEVLEKVSHYISECH